MLAKNLVLLEANKSSSSLLLWLNNNVDYCACSKKHDHVLFLFFCPRFCIGTEVSWWKALKLAHSALGRAGNLDLVVWIVKACVPCPFPACSPSLERTKKFKMSGGYDVLAMKEDDVSKLIASKAHLGDPNVDFQMSQYVFKVKAEGIPIINIRKTWEKLLIAARVVASIENPSDVCVLSNKPFGQVRGVVGTRAMVYGMVGLFVACYSQVCTLYWCTPHRWTLHSRNLHQSDPEGFQRAPPSYCN